MSSDEERFLASCKQYSDYPSNLIGDRNPRQTATYKRTFKQHAQGLFRHEADKHVFIICRDFEDNTTDGLTVRNFRNDEQLRKHLGEAVEGPPSSRSTWTLKRDPKCRVILFESNAAGDRCLNATQDMVKRLLSYHQVPSCYLNLLTFYHLSSGLNDSCGTFIGQHSLRHPGSRLPALDRSEYRFHVSYALRTTACTLEDSEIATRDGLADKQRSRRSANDWVQPQAAIHHQFDLISGAAVWFITTSMKPDLGKKGPGKAVMWADHLGSFFKEEHASAVYKHAHSAFESSLNVHLRLAQWSLGDLSGFIHHSEETLVELTRAYIELGADEYDDKDIQRLGRLMDRVALCLMDISSNRKVFKSLISFYKRQIVEPGHMMSSCDWRDTGRDAVSNFVADMDVFMAELDAITDRATALKEMVKRRTDSISTLLQNQSNKRMLALTKQGQKEAVVVALFQYIALFFLPMTVVSAVFSTDIVKFQDLSPGQVLSYSPDALNYWLVTTICLTVLTVGVSEVWKYKRRQRDLHEDDNTGRTSSDEEEEEDMEKSFGNSRDKVTRSCDQTAPVTRTQRSRGDSRRDRGGDFGARPEARAEGIAPTTTAATQPVMMRDRGRTTTLISQMARPPPVGHAHTGHVPQAPATYHPSSRRKRTRFLRAFGGQRRVSPHNPPPVTADSSLSSSHGALSGNGVV